MFRKTALLLVIFFASASLLLAASGKKKTPKIPKGYKTVTHVDAGFSIGYPKDWAVEESQDGVMLKSPCAEGDEFAENINVIVEKGDQGISLNEYYKISIDNMIKAVPSYKEIKIKEVTINGIKAKRIVATYTIGEIKIKSLIFLMVKGNRGIAVVCTAVEDSFGKFEKPFDSIIKTLTLE